MSSYSNDYDHKVQFIKWLVNYFEIRPPNAEEYTKLVPDSLMPNADENIPVTDSYVEYLEDFYYHPELLTRERCEALEVPYERMLATEMFNYQSNVREGIALPLSA